MSEYNKTEYITNREFDMSASICLYILNNVGKKIARKLPHMLRKLYESYSNQKLLV